MSQDLLDSCATLIRRHEGLRLKPYTDTTGHLTIGYGRNLQARGISVEEAEYLLQTDMRLTYTALQARIPWITQLSDVRQAVLVDMAFNLGMAGLLQFRKTLRLIQAGDYADAGAAMLNSRWAAQVKGRATRLAHMMSTNKWPDDIRP